MSISVIIIAAAVAVGSIAIGLVYNKLVIKDYPSGDKKTGYVVSVIVFLLIGLALFGVLFGRLAAHSLINDFTQKMAQQINTKHSQNSFVKNGINLKNISTDAAQAGAAVGAIKLVLPTSADLGISPTLYNIAIGYATNQMQAKITSLKNPEKVLGAYTENNVLTVSSLTNGLRQEAVTIVNIVTLVLVSVFVILLGIYLIVSLSKAAQQRKKSAA